MFKLRTGYFITGIITGLILLFNFFRGLPDGKLHVVFCDVGQGDATYIQFPSGEDMLIDGGPGGQTPKVLGCLTAHMSLFDRAIDIVVLTHPQEDHLGGLQEIVKRYRVKYFVHSDSAATTEGYLALMQLMRQYHIPERIVGAGEHIAVGSSHLAVLSPPRTTSPFASAFVLGAASDVNESCVVLHLSYGSFDVLLMGDADQQVDPELVRYPLALHGDLDVLKVPHHGSKTGMTDAFFPWIGKTDTAIISVGKNMYGHPAPETLARLEQRGITIHRTDKEGDVEVVSDGKTWTLKTDK